MLHGGEIFRISREKGIEVEKLLDFSANINPRGMPVGMPEAVLLGLRQAIHYPDAECRQLSEALAERENTIPEAVLCGNGAADLIYRIVYGLKPRNALLLEPAFSEYRAALEQGGCEIRELILPEDFQISETVLDKVLELISPELDILFLCNPNNPTGLLTERRRILQIVERAKACGTTVVVDECFLDFVIGEKEYSVCSWLSEFDNLIVLKSFTKMYALPGIRLGYLLCGNREYIKKIQRAGQTWSVNCLAQAAGLFALQQEGYKEETADFVAEESAYLKEQLCKCGFKVYDGRANYLLFQAAGQPDLYDRLLKKNMMIRKCSNYRGLDASYYRIAIRSRRENERLAEALKQECAIFYAE